jgi:hypothetical protein
MRTLARYPREIWSLWNQRYGLNYLGLTHGGLHKRRLHRLYTRTHNGQDSWSEHLYSTKMIDLDFTPEPHLTTFNSLIHSHVAVNSDRTQVAILAWQSMKFRRSVESWSASFILSAHTLDRHGIFQEENHYLPKLSLYTSQFMQGFMHARQNQTISSALVLICLNKGLRSNIVQVR